MTTAESRRFAHQLVTDLIDKAEFPYRRSPDWPKIQAALKTIREQHHRFGPKTTDRPPQEPKVEDEPLPFDGGLRL